MRYILQPLYSFIFVSICLFGSYGTFYSMGNSNQMQSIQQELEEANRAIEEYISGLSPEEQAEFNRQVDEVAQMFDNMSEEEFSAFLGEMFTEEPMPESMYEPYTPPAEVVPVMESTPALSAEQKKKVENIIKIIEDIIRQSNVFMVQINSSLEASNSINEWGKRGKLNNWQPGAQWDTVQLDIERLIQKLYKIEDKDQTTKSYKYLSDLIADEATINNLIQLQTNLNMYVPRIEISELDIQALSSQAKEAIKNSLNSYTEHLYIVKIPEALDAIFEKYEPTATKSKEAEEAAEKKALDSLKKQRTPIAATSAGVSDEDRYNDYGYGGYGYDSGYGGYDYGYDYGGGYSSPFGSYGGGYDDYGFDKEGSSSKGKGGGGSGGSSGGGGGSAGGGKEKQGDRSAQQQKQVASGPTATKDPRIKNVVEEIVDGMKEISKIIEDNNLLAIADHTNETEEKSPVQVDIANGIATIDKKVTTMEADVKQLLSFMKKVNKNTQATYNQKLNAGIEKILPMLTKFDEAITEIKYKQNKKKISVEKQWAYFEEDDKVLKSTKSEDDKSEDKITDLKKNIKKRVSLVILQENIQKLFAAFSELKKNTAQQAETKIVTQTIKTEPTEPNPVEPAPTEE